MTVDEKDAQPSSPGDEDASPQWDEAAGCFWFSTSLNAYDIPDGNLWQQEFQRAMTRNETEFLTPELKCLPTPSRIPRVSGCQVGYEEPISDTSAQKTLCERPSSPSTPKRTPLQRVWSSPKTPPLYRASSPATRAKRATHTKALRSMKQNAGVSTVVQGREVAIFRFGGELFAVGARCPHQGGNLCEGEVGDMEDMLEGESGRCSKQHYVTCPVHKMQFDLRDGSVIDGKCAPMKTYRVRVKDVDEGKKTASIEIGFSSLADSYFFEMSF